MKISMGNSSDIWDETIIIKDTERVDDIIIGGSIRKNCSRPSYQGDEFDLNMGSLKIMDNKGCEGERKLNLFTL